MVWNYLLSNHIWNQSYDTNILYSLLFVILFSLYYVNLQPIIDRSHNPKVLIKSLSFLSLWDLSPLDLHLFFLPYF